ncbi:unnamed protein product, partial [marine sediment metagenome]
RSGLGTYVSNLVKGLLKRGHKVTLITLRGQNVVSLKALKIITLKKNRLDPTDGKWLSFSYKACKLLKKLEKSKKFDLVHFASTRDGFFSKTRIPSVGMMHDYYFAIANKNPFYYKKYYRDWIKRYFYCHLMKFLDKKPLKKISLVFCNSYYVANILNKVYSIPKTKKGEFRP